MDIVDQILKDELIQKLLLEKVKKAVGEFKFGDKFKERLTTRMGEKILDALDQTMEDTEFGYDIVSILEEKMTADVKKMFAVKSSAKKRKKR